MRPRLRLALVLRARRLPLRRSRVGADDRRVHGSLSGRLTRCHWSRVRRRRFGRVVGRRRRRLRWRRRRGLVRHRLGAIARIDNRLTLVDGRLLLDRRGVVVIGVGRRLDCRQESRLGEIRRVTARIEIGIRRRVTAVRRDRRPALLLLVGLPGSERRRDWRAG